MHEASGGDGLDVYEMLQEIPADENGFQNSAYGKTATEYASWLKRRVDLSRGAALEKWQVPETTYWLYVDGHPVGFGKVRHRLTEALLKAGGHIGYAIRPSSRGKGYGNIILKLLLKKARGLGLEKVMLDCLVGNVYSRKVIEANGGSAEKEEKSRVYYWITL